MAKIKKMPGTPAPPRSGLVHQKLEKERKKKKKKGVKKRKERKGSRKPQRDDIAWAG